MSFPQERLVNKIRRKFLEILLPRHTQLMRLAAAANHFYDHLEQSEFMTEVSVGARGNIIYLTDVDYPEFVLVSLVVDVLGKQASLIVYEAEDVFGVGRFVKKYLDSQKYHVYYENQPMMIIDKKMAIGYESVVKLQTMTGHIPAKPSEGSENETKH